MPARPTSTGDDVTEIVFTDAEAGPIVASAASYSQVIVFNEAEAEIIEGRAPGYTNVVFDESESEPIIVDREPAYEVIFRPAEVEPIIVQRPAEIVFDESEVGPIIGGAPLDGAPTYRDDPAGTGPGPGPAPYADVLAPRRRKPRATPPPVTPIQRIDFTEPVVITGTPPRTGPTPVQRTPGLTDRHRQLLGKRTIRADAIERWGVREAGRALLERRLSRTGTSRFLADYKDRWIRAHRDVIAAAAEKHDIPAWVLASVAWTEVAGDPEVQDEVAVFGLRPEKVSFGPVQMELRRAAEELGYDPISMSAIQRRVLIWSLLDPQQNLFLVASHLDRLRDIDAPGRPGSELSEEDVRILGARYNRGPDLTREEILTTGLRTGYGDNVLRKRERVELLLTGELPRRTITDPP